MDFQHYMNTPIQKSQQEQRQAIQELSHTVLMQTWWMTTMEDLEVIWKGVRSSQWTAKEEMNYKLDWLASRSLFYSWSEKNEKFKAIENQVLFEQRLESFMRFIPSLRYRFHELYNRWPGWNHDKEELVKRVAERVQSISKEEAREIWKRWASTAKDYGISLDPDSLYGEKFREPLDLEDKKLMKMIEGGKRAARKKNAEIEHYNHCVLGSSVLLEFLLQEQQTRDYNGVSDSILSSFNSTQREKSKTIFFDIFNQFNTGCPLYEDDKDGFHDWTEKNAGQYYLWKRESADTLKRAFWNFRHPDDVHLVLYETNYISFKDGSHTLLVSKTGEKSIYDIF